MPSAVLEIERHGVRLPLHLEALPLRPREEAVGLRIGDDRSASGSHLSARPSLQEMLPRWQTDTLRWPLSTSAIGCLLAAIGRTPGAFRRRHGVA
jgi:hypothetical protein